MRALYLRAMHDAARIAVERRAAVQYLARQPGNRRQATEDLAWTLMNTLEFVFNH